MPPDSHAQRAPSRGDTPRPHAHTNGHVAAARRERLLLDALALVLASQPETIPSFLRSGNKATHNVACSQAYRHLEVEVAVAGTLGQLSSHGSGEFTRDCCPGYGMRGKLYAVLRSPNYARHVQDVHFRHPCPTHTPTAIDQVARPSDRAEAWEFASSLLGHLPNVHTVVWQTGFGVGGALWTTIASLTKLRRLELITPPLHPGSVWSTPQYPRLTPELQRVASPGLDRSYVNGNAGSRAKAVGHDGWALGPAWENLEVLALDGLSAQGARTFASHLQILANQHDSAQPPSLHTLSLSTHFADLRLCESIAQFGALRSLKHITLSTTGTKLNAECVKVLVEDCTALETLRLTDIEGRLDKNTWAEIDRWPSSLTSFELEISETGSHHSWVLKHLSSIQEVCISQLTRFSVRRLLHSVATLPFPSPSVAVPKTLATHRAERLPCDLLDAIVHGGFKLEELCLDWWEMTIDELEQILLACPQLCKLQVNVKAPIMDIIGMTVAFGNVPELSELVITSDPALGSAAPKIKTARKKSLTEFDDLPQFLADKLADSDPTMVEIRDLRKFARRLPNFRVLRWAGRQGKGEWHFLTSKKSTLTSIDFIPSAVLTKRIWLESQLTVPSFEFEDDGANTSLALEPPISPDRSTSSDLPALSRTTTGSSSSMILSTTPPSVAPAIRRSSSTTSTGVLGLEWEAFPPPLKSPNIATSPTKSSFPSRRESASAPIPILNGKTSEPPRSRGGRNRRESREAKPRLSLSTSPTKVPVTKPLPSPTKESRHVPGSAPRKAPPSPIKTSTKPTSPTKSPTKLEAEPGWTTVQDARWRKK